MARTLAQQEATARALIRQAYALGWTTDDLAIDYAATHMGEDARPLIGRVFARDFKVQSS